MIELRPKYHVELVEKNGQHFYSTDNKATLWPGVTTILSVISKPYLMPWVAKVCGEHTKKILTRVATKYALSPRFIETLYKRSKKQHLLIRDRAADIGSRAHGIFDAMTKAKALIGEKTDVDPDIQVAVDGFISWIGLKTLKIELGDTKIADTTLGYGGSLDALASDPSGRLVVVDYKTSNRISPDYALQVSAYCNAFAKTYGLDYLPEAYIVRFGKEKPEIEVVKVADVPYFFKAFTHALNLYNAIQLPPFTDRQVFKHKKRKKGD